MHRVEATAVGTVFLMAVVSAVAVHRRLPWIPILYLTALVVAPLAVWMIVRVADWGRRWTWSAAGLVGLVFVSLLPVPWMKMRLEHPPGSAWRLDGGLIVNGVAIDPPGTWYWLTAGRPPILAEVVRGWLSDDGGQPTSMLDGRRAHRPAIAEPAAAVVGLRRAGWPLELGVTVEVSTPVHDGLPGRAVVSALNGREVTTRQSWDQAAAVLGDHNTFTTADGVTYEFGGTVMPYLRVDLIDTPRGDLDVVVGGRLARTLPGSWFRQLSVGRSHGLIVALVSYVYASGNDLAAGRTIAGTGKIDGDGQVGPIGGLAAKAAAAREIGADVLVFPDGQQPALHGFDAGPMRMCPVASLEQAIEALAQSPGAGGC